ncbi:head-tail connector protein [Streptomyces sp. E5N91]|uniref:head-tail connector protein n=1 Tax=Streptomyces sp. E5N91 TaxID=1851996 RepID=UPI000EF5AF2E|nr:head-tail connector protein [Streptomyces sp. E5N91]
MALLTLTEAKAQLNIRSDADDTELTAYIEAVGPVVERFVGPVDPREVVETQDAPRDGARVLVLRTLPVLELTSVVPLLTGGTAYDVSKLVLDGDTGVVQRADSGWLRGPLRVTYQAGRTSVPATINLAARMLVQHLWKTQNAGRGPVLAGGDDLAAEPIPGFGYAVPNRVLQLLEPYRLAPGVA